MFEQIQDILISFVPYIVPIIGIYVCFDFIGSLLFKD